MLDGYTVALTLSLKMLSTTCDWWEWFAEALTAHANQVLDRACSGLSCTTKVRAQCWQRAMGSLRGFFLELRKVRVQATGAEHHTDYGNKHGILLHSTLQELRIMEEFRAADFVRHRMVQDGMIEHIYETYQLRDSTDVTPRVKALETKLEDQAKTIGQHQGELNRLKK